MTKWSIVDSIFMANNKTLRFSYWWGEVRDEEILLIFFYCFLTSKIGIVLIFLKAVFICSSWPI